MTPQRYVFDGPYREFRGYVFANRRPVTITDSGTLEAIKREPDFRRVEETAGAVPDAPGIRRPMLHTRKGRA